MVNHSANASVLGNMNIRRIAVLRALQLGDLMVAVPALRALRQRFPYAEITLIGLPWAATFVQRFNHLLDRFIEFPGYPGINELPYDPKRTSRFLAEQRDYGYDLAIQMHGSGRTSNPFVLALGARMTLGAYSGECPAELTFAVAYDERLHEIERNLSLLAPLAITAVDRRLEFPLTVKDHTVANEILLQWPRKAGPRVIVHPGSRSPARRWPATYFAQVADALVERYGAHIIITGTAAEQEMTHNVLAQMKAPALDLSGQTSLGTLAALLSKVELFVSNDTGPAHIAQAVHCPSITIFGPVDPRRWAPLDQELHPIVRHQVSCSPCGYWTCPIDHRCLRDLWPSTVLEAAQRLLSHYHYGNLTPASSRKEPALLSGAGRGVSFTRQPREHV
jgi:lipopolysaccharide heptosyltransferase II